jgi:hypothetical protein
MELVESQVCLLDGGADHWFIYGDKFLDEIFKLKHTYHGLLSMVHC